MPKPKKKEERKELHHPPSPPAPRPKLSGTVFGAGGIIFALLGLFFLPLVMGIIAVWCGVRAWRLHANKVGTTAIVLGLLMTIFAVVGIIAKFRELGFL